MHTHFRRQNELVVPLLLLLLLLLQLLLLLLLRGGVEVVSAAPLDYKSGSSLTRKLLL